MVITTIGHLRPLVVFLCTFFADQRIKFEIFQKAMCMSFGTKTSDVNCQIAFSVIRMGLSLGRATRILGSGANAKLQVQFSFVLLFRWRFNV